MSQNTRGAQELDARASGQKVPKLKSTCTYSIVHTGGFRVPAISGRATVVISGKCMMAIQHYGCEGSSRIGKVSRERADLTDGIVLLRTT